MILQEIFCFDLWQKIRIKSIGFHIKFIYFLLKFIYKILHNNLQLKPDKRITKLRCVKQ